MVLEEKYKDYTIKKDISHQVIRLDIPEIMMEYRPVLPLYPTLKDIITPHSFSRHFPFISASIISTKAKHFDDGLYAAVEMALQKGTEKIPGKKLFLSRILKSLKEMPSAQNIIYCRAFIFAALELGGQHPSGDKETEGLAKTLKENFLGKTINSKPLSFYTWNREFEEIFKQNRFLQTGLIPPDFPVLLADGLMLNPLPLAQGIIRSEQKEIYNKYLELNAKLTGPWDGEIKDLRPLIDMISQDRDISIDGYSALFPPYSSYEKEIVKKIYNEGLLSEDFNLADKLLEEIKRGCIDLTPKEISGWYDYQVYSLESLVRPEKFPEAEKLEFTENYKKELIKLFKSLMALMRETHIQQEGGMELGFEEEKLIINISPRLSVEPLITYYLRRALAYNFIRKVLLDFFGKEELKKIHRLTAGGEIEDNLFDELIYMESLFYGAAELSASEIGHTPELPEEYRPDIDKNRAMERVKKWEKNLSEDRDLSGDNRMMVPVFYDPEKDRTKVWVFMGYEKKTIEMNFSRPPEVEVFDKTGHKLEKEEVEIVYKSNRRELICPVSGEIYVKKILNREEFRRVCNNYISPGEILSALEKGEVPEENKMEEEGIFKIDTGTLRDMTNKIPHYKQQSLGSLLGNSLSPEELRHTLKNFKDIKFEEEEIEIILNHIISSQVPEKVTKEKKLEIKQPEALLREEKKKDDAPLSEVITPKPYVSSSSKEFEITEKNLKILKRKISKDKLELLKTLKNKRFFEKDFLNQLKILNFKEDEIGITLENTGKREEERRKKEESQGSFVSNLFKKFLKKD